MCGGCVEGKEKGEEDDEEMLPPYQDDREALLRPKAAGVAMAMSPAAAGQMSRESKTTSRTYTDTEGNVITEVC